MSDTLKVLYLVPKNLWERRVSASRRHDVMALQRREDVELKLSGIGWSDWDNTFAAIDNVDNIMPGANVVLTYKLAGNPPMGIPSVIEPASIADDYLVATKYQECWWPDDGSAGCPPAWQQALNERVGLVICSHANDLQRFDRIKDKCQAVYLPHCAEESVFAAAAKPWGERDIDILLTGAVGLPHYPLRVRLAKLMKDGKLPGKCHHLPHPGYWRDSIAECEAVVREYAGWLGRSKIALCTCSKWRYRLAKIPEAAMAGCIVVGDLPEYAPGCRDTGEREFMHSFDERHDSEEVIINTFRSLLAYPETSKHFGVHSRQRMLANFTQDHWAEWFCDAVRKAIA